MLAQREAALARRHQFRGAALTEHTRKLKSLAQGTTVSIQNQQGNHPLRWEHTGTVVETGDYDKYTVKVDGSGRLTTRNRRFLRPIQPYRDELSRAPSRPAENTDFLETSPDHQSPDDSSPTTKPVPAPRRSHRIMRKHVSEM